MAMFKESMVVTGAILKVPAASVKFVQASEIFGLFLLQPAGFLRVPARLF